MVVLVFGNAPPVFGAAARAANLHRLCIRSFTLKISRLDEQLKLLGAEEQLRAMQAGYTTVPTLS